MMKDDDCPFHSDGPNSKSARVKIFSLVMLENDMQLMNKSLKFEFFPEKKKQIDIA